MIKAFTVTLIFTIAHSSLSAEEIAGSIEEYGIYKHVGEKKTVYAPETATSYSTFGNFVRVKKTDKIPVIKGISFGFKWSANGFQDSDKIKITHLLVHPPIRMPNGKVSEESLETYFYKPVNGMISHTEGYSFTEDYELVDGKYVFSVIYNNKVIIKKTFVATKAKGYEQKGGEGVKK